MGTPGGKATYYSGAIQAAQDYLAAYARTNVINVMIVLSDGDANATSADMGGTVTSYASTGECNEAMSIAETARSAGTLIYSVSYGSEADGRGCTDANDNNSPCTTMQGIASSPSTTYFFSVPKAKGGTVCPNATPDTTLNQVFTSIAGDLTAAKLIPSGTT